LFRRIAMFESIVKRTTATLVVLAGIVGAACTQSVPPKEEATKESAQALGEGGCGYAGHTDVVPAWGSYLPNCYNWGVNGLPTTWASPNTDATSAGYCPDQAVFDLVREQACSIGCKNIRTCLLPCQLGNSVTPHMEMLNQDPQHPVDCSLWTASVGIMVRDSPSEAFRGIGVATAPVVSEGGTCVVEGFSGTDASGNALLPLDPGLHQDVRFVGEVYFKSKGETLSYPGFRLTVQNNVCIG
jgi:hypothetical protein